MRSYKRSAVLALIAAMTVHASATAAEPPKPYGITPSQRQLDWSTYKAYAFVHFSMNTFTDKEWGYGDEPEKLFNPTDFDADQIVSTVKNAGLTGLVLTCKHHDGFCLWPSAFTEHSVKNSPWKNGKGDVVKEISDACRRHGIKFGVYLSPWDRNSSLYGSPEYITYYRNQLKELLSNYGPVFEVWFDGANGGDGYYGGARETRKIDRGTYYDWPHTWEMVRQLQPEARMFSDIGPDTRWVGNEDGVAGEPCWQTLNAEGLYPGKADQTKLNHGDRQGTSWIPAEADVSIRPGWFYHAAEDHKVKSPGELTKLYFESVGRGANLILNLPPDRRGQIPGADVKSLMGWNQILTKTFATNLADGAVVEASNVRGNDERFAAVHLLDSTGKVYWASDDAVLTPHATISLPKSQTFNVIQISEYLPLGQRCDSLAFDVWTEGQWKQIATCTSVGPHRLIQLPSEVATDKVRLRVTSASACPALWDLGLFKLPASQE